MLRPALTFMAMPNQRGGMIEALVAAAGIGFLLGLRYRIPAAIIASAVAAAAGGVVACLTGASLWGVLIAPLAAMAALQCGYLAGLLAAVGVSRARLPGWRRD